MAKEQLPIYKIEDFRSHEQNQKFFYLSTFSEHLLAHKFIQKPHKHNFFIVLIITSGSGTHTIDFNEYPVSAGNVYFLTPGQVHNWQLSADTNGFIFFFTQEYYQDQKKLYNLPFFGTLSGNAPLLLSETEQTQLLQVILPMQEEYRQHQEMKDDILNDYLDILLLKLLRIYNAKHSLKEGSRRTMPELLKLQNLIDQHYKEHRPVSFYSELLHTTPKHLNDVSKDALGKTTTQIIQERVVLEAKRLLVHSALRIKEIASETGFYDTSYFFRFFKKNTGKTPEQFRLEHV